MISKREILLHALYHFKDYKVKFKITNKQKLLVLIEKDTEFWICPGNLEKHKVDVFCKNCWLQAIENWIEIRAQIAKFSV